MEKDSLLFWYKREHAIVFSLTKLAVLISQLEAHRLKWAVKQLERILSLIRKEFGLVPKHLRDGDDAYDMYCQPNLDMYFFDHYFEETVPEADANVSLRVGLQLCEGSESKGRKPKALVEVKMIVTLMEDQECSLTLTGDNGLWELRVWPPNWPSESDSPLVNELRETFSEFITSTYSRIGARRAFVLIRLMVRFFISKQELPSS